MPFDRLLLVALWASGGPDLHRCYGKPGEFHLATECCGKGLYVLSQGIEQVRTGRIMISDVQNLDRSGIVGQLNR
jgi:hypothetical protein